MTIVSFIIALGVLVFIHEFGHFIVAKLQGIGVEKFSLGFGPKLLSFKKGETTYLVSALPLGGYVKLHGEESGSEEANDRRSYAGRPIHQRMRVVFAGPMMNLLLALFLMPIIFMIGRAEPSFLGDRPVVVGVRADSPAAAAGLQKGDEIVSIDGKRFENWKELMNFVLLNTGKTTTLEVRRAGVLSSKSVTIARDDSSKGGYLGIEPIYFFGNEATVDEVAPDGPAAAAGIKPGDQVLGIDGKPVEDWSRMSELVQASGGTQIKVRIKRGGEILHLSVTPKLDPAEKRWLMGVQKDLQRRGIPMVEKKYPFFEAIREGTKENVRLAGMTVEVFGRLITLKLSYKTLGGPIRIAQAAGMAARSSLSDFLYFLTFLSMQLGILNLLPIPVLDGGHVIFLGYEGLFRQPMAPKIRLAFEQTAFVLLIGLMLLITLNDVDSVWGFAKILTKVKNLF